MDGLPEIKCVADYSDSKREKVGPDEQMREPAFHVRHLPWLADFVATITSDSIMRPRQRQSPIVSDALYERVGSLADKADSDERGSEKSVEEGLIRPGCGFSEIERIRSRSICETSEPVSV
jgi:hypothetical protein